MGTALLIVIALVAVAIIVVAGQIAHHRQSSSASSSPSPASPTLAPTLTSPASTSTSTAHPTKESSDPPDKRHNSLLKTIVDLKDESPDTTDIVDSPPQQLDTVHIDPLATTQQLETSDHFETRQQEPNDIGAEQKKQRSKRENVAAAEVEYVVDTIIMAIPDQELDHTHAHHHHH